MEKVDTFNKEFKAPASGSWYYVKLNNGTYIPCIGMGTGILRWNKTPFGTSLLGKVGNKFQNIFQNFYKSRKIVKSYENALQAGYRFLDYSSAYRRGDLIQKAIQNSGIKREDMYMVSRVSNIQQYNKEVRDGFFATIKDLGVEYLDLYLFHWPVTNCFIETYKEMERLYKEGYVKAIGVCNCHQHHLQSIFDECEIIPSIDQFEVHPLFTQKPLINFCKEHGIQVMAYTPLARNDDRLRSNLILRGLCNKYNKSRAQIILRWDIQQGIIPIPRSSNKERQASNLNIFDFELSCDDMDAIDSININSRLRYDPDNLDFHSIG